MYSMVIESSVTVPDPAVVVNHRKFDAGMLAELNVVTTCPVVVFVVVVPPVTTSVPAALRSLALRRVQVREGLVPRDTATSFLIVAALVKYATVRFSEVVGFRIVMDFYLPMSTHADPV